MAVRAPHVHAAVRAFCVAAFAALAPEAGDPEIPFVVDEHGSGLYEYRPLVRDHVQARAFWLAKLPDARVALDELQREPAAAVFAGPSASDRRALFQAILLPTLTRTAETRGGFDWEDGAFERVYADLERSLYGASRRYTAAAPLVGVSVPAAVGLARGIGVRPASREDLVARWPDAGELLPAGFGEEPERASVLELECELAPEDAPPDAADELAAAVTALRLATGAPVAAGPAVLERLDWHPFGARAMPGLAATAPAGDPGRLDPWRAGLAGELLGRLGGGDLEGRDAIERWEAALLEDEPARSERLRESLVALLGGSDGLWAAAMRAALLLGDGSRERSGVIDRLRALARGESGGVQIADDVRRAIVETLQHPDRARLATALDEAMLGVRPRPAGYYSARAAAS